MQPSDPVEIHSPVQAPAPAEGGAPPAPTGPAAPPPECGRGLGRWLAVLFVAAFAFLLASHPARNCSLWGQLAAGRDLAHFDAPAVLEGLPAQRGWAYDLALYWIHLAAGGVGLLFVKALLFGGLALVLFDLSRAYGGWWVPVGCTSLALLAGSTRLLLQPVTVSYLFLGLALWLLRPRPGGVRPGPLPPWPLLGLFVVWANTDAWCVVGLATVALVMVGRALDATAGGAPPSEGRGLPDASPFRHLLLGLGLLAAACLLNPNHFRAFAPPEELSRLLGMGGVASGRVGSPFQPPYLSSVGATPAGLAFFPLLGLTVLSFALDLRGWRWQRFLPWLGLATLSCFEAKAVPFFAVVGGPVLAWNLRDILDRPFAVRLRSAPSGRRGRVAWYCLASTLALVLVACVWPGWMQRPPFEPRRWAVDLPLPPVRGAEAVRDWYERGELPPGSRFLHLSDDTAYAFAWFCPEVRGSRDARLGAGINGGPEASLQQRMRAAGIDHVVLYDRDGGNLSATLSRFSSDPVQWPLLFMEGGVAIFGWRDPTLAAAPDPFRNRRLDLNRLAFRSNPEGPESRGLPEKRPVGRRWWDAFWKPAPAGGDRDEAMLYALYAEALRRNAPERRLAAWEAGQAAALVGTVAGRSSLARAADASVRLVFFRPVPSPGDSGPTRLPPLNALAEAVRQRVWRQRDDAPPALLYLTVRAARRAVALNPDDAQSYLLLGEAYLRLLHATRERVWATRMPELAQLRLAQASAALNRALVLRPGLAQAHLGLGGLYRDLGYLDLAEQHLRAYLTLAKKAGPPSGVDADSWDAAAASFEEDLRRLSQTVKERLQAHATEASGKRISTRASSAQQKGLAGLARDSLLDSDIAAFGPEGLALELELLLGTGRAEEVREWTDPRQKDSLGTAYHWLRAQAMAALGEYVEAREECDALEAALGPVGEGAIGPEVIAGLVGWSVLDGMPAEGGLPPFANRAVNRAEKLGRLLGFTRVFRRQADVWTIRGLLALEQGEVGEADDAFRQALVPWAGGRGLDFSGRPAAEGYLALLEAARR